jgi:acetyl esterase/lipase
VGSRSQSSVRLRHARRAALLALCALVCVLVAPAAQAHAAAQTFQYTGGEQAFTVPAGVSNMEVLAVGGSGGSSNGAGGAAAQVTGDLSVAPGETLYVEVGGNGPNNGVYGGGGFNGGGEGAGGGGGASDVRTSPLALGLSPDDRLLVAGGGGGGGTTGRAPGAPGGAAGEAGGNTTSNEGGGAGTQVSGGSGGSGGCANGSAGELGIGGNAGVCNYNGGGGGGGYYGGGGGGSASSKGGGGGGGGSSLVPAGGNEVLASLETQPQVLISYTEPSPTVAKLKPAKGPVTGGISVTITGTNFTGATAVKFGATNAASFVAKSATSLTAVSAPEAAGKVDVTVTTPAGTSSISSKDHFSFTPTVTGLSPNSGAKAGGTSVTVTGTGFALGATATIFRFGSTKGTSVNCTSTTTCTVVSPTHEVGTVDVKAAVNKVTSVKNAPADQFTYKEGGLPSNFNLHYGAGELQTLDVYPGAQPNAPLVVLVHGGGWMGGDKGSDPPKPQAEKLKAQGFAVFNVDYRMDEGGAVPGFPKEVEDVESAVRWAIEHAVEYNANPNRVALVGGSAGAHLVSMAAIGLNATPGTVRGVVTLSGAFDLLKVLEDERAKVEKIPGVWGPDLRKALQCANVAACEAGGKEATAALYSPSRHVNSSNKPSKFLIFNSEGEETTSKDQPLLMKTALEAAGCPVAYTEVAGTGHSFTYWAAVETQIYAFINGLGEGAGVVQAGARTSATGVILSTSALSLTTGLAVARADAARGRASSP